MSHCCCWKWNDYTWFQFEGFVHCAYSAFVRAPILRDNLLFPMTTETPCSRVWQSQKWFLKKIPWWLSQMGRKGCWKVKQLVEEVHILLASICGRSWMIQASALMTMSMKSCSKWCSDGYFTETTMVTASQWRRDATRRETDEMDSCQILVLKSSYRKPPIKVTTVKRGTCGRSL